MQEALTTPNPVSLLTMSAHLFSKKCLHTSAMPLFILTLSKILSNCHVVNWCGCYTTVKFGKQFFKPYRKFHVNIWN